eukprot:gene9136-8234_t
MELDINIPELEEMLKVRGQESKEPGGKDPSTLGGATLMQLLVGFGSIPGWEGQVSEGSKAKVAEGSPKYNVVKAVKSLTGIGLSALPVGGPTSSTIGDLIADIARSTGANIPLRKPRSSSGIVLASTKDAQHTTTSARHGDIALFVIPGVSVLFILLAVFSLCTCGCLILRRRQARGAVRKATDPFEYADNNRSPEMMSPTPTKFCTGNSALESLPHVGSPRQRTPPSPTSP